MRVRHSDADRILDMAAGGKRRHGIRKRGAEIEREQMNKVGHHTQGRGRAFFVWRRSRAEVRVGKRERAYRERERFPFDRLDRVDAHEVFADAPNLTLQFGRRGAYEVVRGGELGLGRRQVGSRFLLSTGAGGHGCAAGFNARLEISAALLRGSELFLRARDCVVGRCEGLLAFRDRIYGVRCLLVLF